MRRNEEILKKSWGSCSDGSWGNRTVTLGHPLTRMPSSVLGVEAVTFVVGVIEFGIGVVAIGVEVAVFRTTFGLKFCCIPGDLCGCLVRVAVIEVGLVLVAPRVPFAAVVTAAGEYSLQTSSTTTVGGVEGAPVAI